MRFVVVACLAGSVVASYQCPGSPAAQHAGLRMTQTAAASCDVVMAEMRSRVAGDNGWYDQHNRGTYTEQSYDRQDDGHSTISFSRLTGDGRYTDKMTFVLNPDGSSCKIEGCSESQVGSYLDFSTNYCEQKLLVCGSEEGCNVAQSDFTSTEDEKELLAGASANFRNCLKVSPAAPVLGTELRWATFDGAVGTTAPWNVQNDPVMGGASTSDFELTSDNTGVFKGSCNIIPFLGAPGVATLRAQNFQFADATDFENIALKVKSSTPDYQGFKISFGAPGVPNAQGPQFGPPRDGSYKADFVLSGSDWQVIEVPLTQFSYDWSSYTGRCDSKDPPGYDSDGPQHNCCSDSGIEPSSPDVCVDSQYLNKVNYVDISAEGVEGEFKLEIEWIGATKSEPGRQGNKGSVAVPLMAVLGSVAVLGLLFIACSVVAKRRVGRSAQDPLVASSVGQSLQPVGTGS